MKDLYKKQFGEYLEKFMDELKKTGKEEKELIESKYDKFKDYVDNVKNNIYEYKSDFLNEEKKLNDLFEKNSIEIIDGVNLSSIWNKSDSDNKSAIIQYLKVFIFILEASEEKKTENNDFEEMLKKSLLDEDNNLKSFCKNLNEQDNSIVNMAKSIASELKTEDNINDNDISSLMGNNGKGLGALIGKITNKIDNEIKSGRVSHADLLKDAKNMMGGGNGDLFSNLFKGLGNMNMPNNMGQTNNMNQTNNMSQVNKQTSSVEKQEKKNNATKKVKKKK